MQRIDFAAMGCALAAITDSDSPAAISALSSVPDWFEEWECILSRFRDDSELSALNRFAGYWFTPSDVLWEVLNAALSGAAFSADLVTPTVLPQLLAVGYDRPFKHLGTEASTTTTAVSVLELPAPAPAPSWRDIEIDIVSRAIRLPAGMALDLGGVAKGWAADQAACRMAEMNIGSVMIDAGGDIALRGVRADGAPWPVGVADPRAPASPEPMRLDVLMLNNCGVATSGTDYRRWQHNGMARHHIIDPLTGLPAETDVLSATVVADNAALAEIAAKTVLIKGCADGVRWLEQQSGMAGLVVAIDGGIHRSAGFDALTWTSYWTRTQEQHGH